MKGILPSTDILWSKQWQESKLIFITSPGRGNKNTMTASELGASVTINQCLWWIVQNSFQNRPRVWKQNIMVTFLISCCSNKDMFQQYPMLPSCWASTQCHLKQCVTSKWEQRMWRGWDSETLCLCFIIIFEGFFFNAVLVLFPLTYCDELDFLRWTTGAV